MLDTPPTSGTSSPHYDDRVRGVLSLEIDERPKKKKLPIKKLLLADSDSDIEPEDLLSAYIDCQVQLYHIKSQPRPSRRLGRVYDEHNAVSESSNTAADPMSKLERRLARIEADVLFDKYAAQNLWQERRTQLEKARIEALKDAQAQKQTTEGKASDSDRQEPETSIDSEDDLATQARNISASLLEAEDEMDLEGLFANLPTNEVDTITGQSRAVIKDQAGVQIVIRDFGKWTGTNPTRVLEEVCKSRLINP